jgi:hypothetical protein
MERLEMTRAAGRIQQPDIRDDLWPPDADEDSSDGSPAMGEAQPRHQKERRSASYGLAILSVVIGLLGGFGGYYGSRLLPVQYAARAEIQYSLAGAEPNDVLREDRKLGTQVLLLRSRLVLSDVAAANGLTPDQLADKVSANLADNSEVIEVELRDWTPEGARALLAAVADRYLQEANANWQDPVSSYLKLQLAQLQKQKQAPGLLPEDVAKLTQLEQFLNDMISRLEQAPPAGVESLQGPPAQLWTEPYVVAGQVSPRPKLAAAAGAGTAAVVAALVVLLVIRRQQRT